MQQEIGEVELLEASVAGDRNAFGALVERYQSLVCAITYSVTGSIERSEELAQEAFITAWRNLRQLRDLSRFRAWLCTIARNLAGQAIRKRSSDGMPAGVGLDGEGAAADEPGPSEALIAKERQETVWAALQKVPQAYREPMVLFYRRQRSVSQVASDLGLSEEAVRQRLHRGRQLIKAEVSSLVEDTLARSGPGKAFAVAVIAAVPALITPPASAAVAGIAAKGTPAAETLFAGSLSGAILGPILGLLGGILGAWFSIKNTKSPRECRFMIVMVVLICVLLAALVALPLTLAIVGAVPKWCFWVSFSAFFVVLLPLLFWGNARQTQIQIRDGTYEQPKRVPMQPHPAAIRANFAGAIFGSTLWLLILVGMARDWAALVLILACDGLIFYAAPRACLREPQRYWSAALFAVCAVAAMTLAAVNLRWNAWMLAYRESRLYDPANDVTLLTINLVIAGLFGFLLLLFVILHVRHKAVREHEPSSGHES